MALMITQGTESTERKISALLKGRSTELGKTKIVFLILHKKVALRRRDHVIVVYMPQHFSLMEKHGRTLVSSVIAGKTFLNFSSFCQTKC